jgi:hypothetical protein
MAIDFIPPTVAVADDLSDYGAFVANADLVCRRITLGVAPHIARAELVWRAGLVAQPGDASAAQADPADLVGKFVKITDSDLGAVWFGYVLDEDYSRRSENGSGDLQGDQVFTAVGLEWFLDRAPVEGAVYYTTAAGVDNENRVSRSPGFNTGRGLGRDVGFESRGNQDTRFAGPLSTKAVFSASPDYRTLWAGDDIVDYLLNYHAPADVAGAAWPVAFSLAATARPFLSWFSPTVVTEGRTLWSILNELANPRRGLVLFFTFDATPGSETVVVNVSSALASALSLPGGGTVPAASTQATWAGLDTDDELGDVRIGRKGAREYQQVKVRGARRRSVFTVSIADGTLEPGWSSSAETDYLAAVASTPANNATKRANDRYRQSHELDRVFAAFVLPVDWDGKSGDGSGGGSTEYACPILSPTGSILGGEPANTSGLRLVRTLPILTGYDYTDPTDPTPNTPDDVDGEPMRPFVVFDVDPFGLADYRFGHKITAAGPNSQGSKFAVNFGLRVLDGAPGVQLFPSGGLNHSAAPAGDWSGASPSAFAPEQDYSYMRCTVCAEWDSYCEGIWPDPAASGRAVETLVLYLGDRYRLDYMAAGTVFDVGQLADVSYPLTSSGGVLQDDREALRDIARLAFEWYSTPRRTVSIPLQGIGEPLALGTLLTSVGTGANLETVNATVSQIVHDYESSGRSSIACGYAELDFAGLFA